MKNLIYIFVCIVTLISCQQSDQGKAENLIKKMSNAMPENIRIEPIKFGVLQKAIIDYELTYQAYLIRKEMERQTIMMREYKETIDEWGNITPALVTNDIKKAVKCANIIQELEDSLQNEKLRFTPDTNRYMMKTVIKHSSKNGIQTIDSVVYYFNKELTRIVGALGPIDNSGKEVVYMELEDMVTPSTP